MYPGVPSASCSTVTGWVCDQDNTATPLQVDLYDYTNAAAPKFIGSSIANRDMFDGENLRNNCGHGPIQGSNIKINHGYSFTIPQSLKDGKNHLLKAYGLNINTVGEKMPTRHSLLIASPANLNQGISLACALTPETPTSTSVPTATRTPAPVGKDQYTPGGYVAYPGASLVSCSTITGWSCDRDAPNKFIQVDFWDKGTNTFLGSAIANRQDLYKDAGVLTACNSTAYHGYSFTIPTKIKDGTKHTINAYGINIDNLGSRMSSRHALLKAIPANSAQNIYLTCKK